MNKMNIENITKILERTSNWKPPYKWIDNTETALRWTTKNKSLTIYVGETHTTYLKAWGHNITSEMEDGFILDDKHIIDIWNWLTEQ